MRILQLPVELNKADCVHPAGDRFHEYGTCMKAIGEDGDQ
jgi:hypothetical protein